MPEWSNGHRHNSRSTGGNDVVDGGLGFDYLLSIGYSSFHRRHDRWPEGREAANYQGKLSRPVPGSSFRLPTICGGFGIPAAATTSHRRPEATTSSTVQLRQRHDRWTAGLAIASREEATSSLPSTMGAGTNSVTNGPMAAGTHHGGKGSFSDGGSRSVTFDNFDCGLTCRPAAATITSLVAPRLTQSPPGLATTSSTAAATARPTACSVVRATIPIS